MSRTLEDSLVGFFKHTTFSCLVINILAEHDKSIRFGYLMEEIGEVLSGKVPDTAIEGALRASMKLLKESGWVKRSGAGFKLTVLGKELGQRIN